MGAVFISYRRDDTQGQARALAIELTKVLGKDAVFMDVDIILLGRDFRQVLAEQLQRCDLMLVLVGDEWLEARDGAGNRRLNDSNDYVRQEIAAALRRGIPVTPLLVGGATLPSADQLPSDIKDFAYRNAFELRHDRWNSDVEEMLRRVGLVRPRRMYWLSGAAVLLVAAGVWFFATWRANEVSNSGPTGAESTPVPDTNRSTSSPAARPDQPADPSSTPASQPDPRVAVEKLVGRWVEAWLAGDTEGFIAPASEPFYFDNQVILTHAKLRTAYEELKAQKGERWKPLQVASIRVQTAGELAAQGQDLSKDRVFGSLNLTSNDFAVTVGIGNEYALVVVRRLPTGFEIVGTWD